MSILVEQLPRPARVEAPGPYRAARHRAGARRPGPDRTPVYAMVGNPNCGKTTLFNALTGLRQKVGNYPGVTVEKKIGDHLLPARPPHPDHRSARRLLARRPFARRSRAPRRPARPPADTPQPDRIICVVDAANLERNLYLVHQILDLGRPVIVALNMMDMAAAAGMKVDAAELEGELGVPVIACEAVHGRGLVELKLAMSRLELPLARHRWDVPAPIAPAVAEIQASLADNDARPPLIARAEALLLLTDFDTVRVAGSEPLSARTHELLGPGERWVAAGHRLVRRHQAAATTPSTSSAATSSAARGHPARRAPTGSTPCSATPSGAGCSSPSSWARCSSPSSPSPSIR
jgi:ferrous iron transport protein B